MRHVIASLMSLALAASLSLVGCQSGPIDWAPGPMVPLAAIPAPAAPTASTAPVPCAGKPATAPELPADDEAPPTPRKVKKARTCDGGRPLRTMRCDGQGELVSPTCSPCKRKGRKGGK